MDWDIFGIIWYFFGGILKFTCICIGAFLIISFLLKQSYKPQSKLEDETEL